MRRRAVEGKMLHHLGMTEGAQVRLREHNSEQTDWHGWCRVCRTHFSGSITTLSGPCPTCGETDGKTSR